MERRVEIRVVPDKINKIARLGKKHLDSRLRSQTGPDRDGINPREKALPSRSGPKRSRDRFRKHHEIDQVTLPSAPGHFFGRLKLFPVSQKPVIHCVWELNDFTG